MSMVHVTKCQLCGQPETLTHVATLGLRRAEPFAAHAALDVIGGQRVRALMCSQRHLQSRSKRARWALPFRYVMRQHMRLESCFR